MHTIHIGQCIEGPDLAPPVKFQEHVRINVFLLFWVSVGSMYLSGKQTHMNLLMQKFYGASSAAHGNSLHGLIHLVAQLRYIASY